MALTFRGNIVGSDIIVGWVTNSDSAVLLVKEKKFQFVFQWQYAKALLSLMMYEIVFLQSRVDTFFQDAHGDSAGRMIKDKSQDYKLIVGYQYQGGTVLRFKRKLNTCDGDDLVITVRLKLL